MHLQEEIDIQRAFATISKYRHPGGAYKKNRDEAIAMIERDALVSPMFNVGLRKIEGVFGDTLDFGELKLFSTRLASVSPALDSVAAVVCTIGPALESSVSKLTAERKLSLALALDEVGNDMLFYTARYALLRVRENALQQGVKSGNSLSPGCNGLGIDQQAVVIAMADGKRLGITVNEGCMLSPVKSRSIVIGLGNTVSMQPLRKTCETCSSGKTCRYRKC